MVTFLPVCEWRRCRFSTWGGNLHSRILPALWAGNFQLLADGPHRPFLDFAMARDAGDLVQRRVEPNAMGSALAIQNATMEPQVAFQLDRKSTRLNSSHGYISYAVFCLKKKKKSTL